jgi:hypothetical protein
MTSGSCQSSGLSNPDPMQSESAIARVVADGGVSVLRARRNSIAVQGSFATRTQRKRICSHNASVCRTAGQLRKSQVWDLLSQIVNRQVGLEENFNGWNGTSLGTNLIRNIFRYYESRGDVQMLATMVCVLRRRKFDQDDISVLDESEEMYDAYIRQYASLLYCWGLLFVRAQVVKYLVHPDLEFTMEIGSRTTRQARRELDGFGPRCGICLTGVRGLFILCTVCGHGGHEGHMLSWFSLQNVCPTGCGCHCVVASVPSIARRSEAVEAL